MIERKKISAILAYHEAEIAVKPFVREFYVYQRIFIILKKQALRQAPALLGGLWCLAWGAGALCFLRRLLSA